MIKIIKEDEFEEVVIKREGTVLVDFFAVWCPPCKMLAPILEDIAKDKKYNIFKVNLDENSILANDYSVSSIPTLIVFKDGVEVERYVGLMDKEEVLEMLNRNM